MRVSLFVIAALFCGFSAFSFFTGYRSAFEADQACHAEKWNIYGEDSTFDCDHDLETNKWILYQVGSNHQAAKVVKRYHY